MKISKLNVKTRTVFSKDFAYKPSGYFSKHTKRFWVYFYYWFPTKSERDEANIWRNL